MPSTRLLLGRRHPRQLATLADVGVNTVSDMYKRLLYMYECMSVLFYSLRECQGPSLLMWLVLLAVIRVAMSEGCRC